MTRQIKTLVISVRTLRAQRDLRTFIRPHQTMSSPWKSCDEDKEKNGEIICNGTAPSRGRQAGKSHPLRGLVTWANVDVDLQMKERPIHPLSLLRQLHRPRLRDQPRVDRGDRVPASLCPIEGQSRPEIPRKNFSSASRRAHTLLDQAKKDFSTTEAQHRPEQVHHKHLLQKEAFYPESAVTYAGAKRPTLRQRQRCKRNLLHSTRVQAMAFKTRSTSREVRTRPSTGPLVTRGCRRTRNARR